MKTITHAQKEMMLQYFEVVETQLRRALKDAAVEGTPTTDDTFIRIVAARVQERIADIATRIPGSSAPSLQQIRKNLEMVLDPVFFGEAKDDGTKRGDAIGENAMGDPIKAVRSLLLQLRQQREYTPPEGGTWKPDARARRGRER
ncbi:MAG: hypothetical protein EXR27_11080 [Betaproteobacteria bacterium]|nr:hypothetical protein [Betaproteobacteria bacterium]